MAFECSVPTGYLDNLKMRVQGLILFGRKPAYRYLMIVSESLF